MARRLCDGHATSGWRPREECLPAARLFAGYGRGRALRVVARHRQPQDGHGIFVVFVFSIGAFLYCVATGGLAAMKLLSSRPFSHGVLSVPPQVVVTYFYYIARSRGSMIRCKMLRWLADLDAKRKELVACWGFVLIIVRNAVHRPKQHPPPHFQQLCRKNSFAFSKMDPPTPPHPVLRLSDILPHTSGRRRFDEAIDASFVDVQACPRPWSSVRV